MLIQRKKIYPNEELFSSIYPEIEKFLLDCKPRSPQKMRKFEEHILVDKGNSTAVELIATQTGLPTKQIKRIMQQGAVWLERGKNIRRLRRVKNPIQKDDKIHFYFDEEVLSQFTLPSQLIADEKDYSIWYKPFGMLSQGSKWGDHCTINRWVEQHLTPQRPAFIVHRLDKAATGLMIIAHTKTAAKQFSAMFQSRQIDKSYRAIVNGNFKTGIKPMLIDSRIQGKEARSFFTQLYYNAEKDQSLVAVKIETGRKHQIRIHLSELGFPIVGDRLYGTGNEAEDLQLSSVKLSFKEPVTNEVKSWELADRFLPSGMVT
jgi:tRNA pseudouridine32 synthase/23S rRNA pseudouridine746 synthase